MVVHNGSNLVSKNFCEGVENAEEMLKGWFVHFNFIRPHQSLNGKTPAEAAGINLNINDGWGDLIELATRYETKLATGK
ncbi:unnamed protein product [marine sediment metagenome]|uniref:Integrase catalytic domain-containing protein n=1 Tax=marine sediment metagenome TaxID=412755 RepID=X0YTM4_9ZZZZ